MATMPQGSPCFGPQLSSSTAPLPDPNTWDIHKSDLSGSATAHLPPHEATITEDSSHRLHSVPPPKSQVPFNPEKPPTHLVLLV